MKIKLLVIFIFIFILVGGAVAAGNYDLYLPVIYNGNSPTATPKPTAIPTPGSWTFVGHAREEDEETKISGSKQSACYSITSSKEAKTITVLSHYIGDEACEAWVEFWNEHGNIPHEIVYPLPICTGDDTIDATFFPCDCQTYELSQQGFFCGAFYSHVYPGGSQKVCSGDILDQCVETR